MRKLVWRFWRIWRIWLSGPVHSSTLWAMAFDPSGAVVAVVADRQTSHATVGAATGIAESRGGWSSRVRRHNALLVGRLGEVGADRIAQPDT